MRGKDRYFHPDGFSSPMRAKGKGHVSFPNRLLFQPALALQAVLAIPHLNTIIWGCECVLSMCPFARSRKVLGVNNSTFKVRIKYGKSTARAYSIPAEEKYEDSPLAPPTQSYFKRRDWKSPHS